MTDHTKARFLSTATLCLGLGLVPAAALAGPCSDQIAQLGKALSGNSSLGSSPTSGTLTGSSPGSAPATAPDTAAGTKGTSAANSIGGTAGTKELNSASNQIATSSQDVRRQQEGLPTAAATAAAPGKGSVETAPRLGQGQAPNDRMALAKSELQNAVALDHNNDSKCMDSVNQARKLMTAN